MRFARAILMIRLLSFVGLLLILVLGGRAAFGHAVLLETTPENGAILDAAPREIVLRFNETVAPIALTLVGRSGQTTIATGFIAARDTALHAAVPDELRPGGYIVSYRVVSADSHPISGAFLFAIGTPSTATPAAPDLREQENRWAFLVILNRIVLLSGLLFTAGGVLFGAAVLGGDPALTTPLRRPLRLGALVTIASAVIAIVLQGGLLTAAQMDALSSQETAILAIGWRSTLGTSAALMATGMLLVLVGLQRFSQRNFLWLGMAGATLATAALAASGHAATAPPRWLATPAMALHGLAIAFWVGSLWPLLRALQSRGAGAADVVRRFSQFAVIAVAVLIATGLMLAVLQLGGDVTALAATPYGLLLLLKLGIVALLLSLATYNKLRLTPALRRGDHDAADRLTRSIRLEIAAVCLILIVTALLGQSPPPRALATQDRGTFAGHGGHSAAGQTVAVEEKGYRATVNVSPARIGRNIITISLLGPGGVPFAALEATAELSLPDQGIEPLTQALKPTAPGRYQWTTDGFLRPGMWLFSLGVLINDFERVTFEAPITITD